MAAHSSVGGSGSAQPGLPKLAMGLEPHLISLATYPQLVQNQGAQGELAQVPDLRSGQMGEVQRDRDPPVAELRQEVTILSPLPTSTASPGQWV